MNKICLQSFCFVKVYFIKFLHTLEFKERMMKIYKVVWSVAFFVACLFAIVAWGVPFRDINSLPEDLVYGDKQDFGCLVNATYNHDQNTIEYKLLNSIVLKSVNVIDDKKYVYLGGDMLGFTYQGDGILVVANNEFDKENNFVSGDVIKAINDIPVTRISQITDILRANKDNEVFVKIVRKGENMDKRVKPAYDVMTQKYKLGVWARDNMSGIGTLTYIDPDTTRYGALGHQIYEPTTKTSLDVAKGEVYKCSVLGVRASVRGTPGEVQGVIPRNNKLIGTVDKNSEYGLFGNMRENSKIMENRELIQVGGRLSTMPGKAYIYSSLDGKTIKAYQIEIIKTNYQGGNSPKNLVFKVVDPELIKLTGGIVQGMSGSPIVQDNKLIGAVTHVFVNDPTKGFGVYIDAMLTQ